MKTLTLSLIIFLATTFAIAQPNNTQGRQKVPALNSPTNAAAQKSRALNPVPVRKTSPEFLQAATSAEMQKINEHKHKTIDGLSENALFYIDVYKDLEKLTNDNYSAATATKQSVWFVIDHYTCIETILKKRNLTETDINDVLALIESIKKVKSEEIKGFISTSTTFLIQAYLDITILDRNGFEVPDCTMYFLIPQQYRSSGLISQTLANASLNTVNNFGEILVNGDRISPNYFHVYISQNIDGIERLIKYSKKYIDGSPITITLN